MDAATVAKLRDQEAAIRLLRQEGRISEEVEVKFLLGVAKDLAVAGGCPDALRLVKSFNEQYYSAKFLEQCTADDDFAVGMYGLARRLVDEGYVNLGPHYGFHGPVGQA